MITSNLTGVVCGNSDVLLDQLIDEGVHFDLILTDPPYNINKDFGNKSDCLPLDEFIAITAERMAKIKKLLEPQGSVLWFGIHDYIGFVQVAMYNAGLHYRRMNIWHYENGFSRSKKEPATHYEPFLWFSNNPKKWTYNVDDVRMPYKSTERLKSPVKYKAADGTTKYGSRILKVQCVEMYGIFQHWQENALKKKKHHIQLKSLNHSSWN